MRSKISKIWNERKKIIDGIKNALVRDKFVEVIHEQRMNICNSCEHMGDKCMVPGTGPCCNDCGCSLSFATRSLSYDCPKGKWKALLSEEQEDKLNELN
tara:strand:- start:10883 stop:11179 length:297 start_codon:yes stop_codon:yes gene_type:complete